MSDSLKPSPTADNHGVVTLPVIRLPECNRCGACCENGGDCELRPWIASPATGERLPTQFVGRCEHLVDQGFGFTLCDVIRSVDVEEVSAATAERMQQLLNGRCEWPILRRPNAQDAAPEGGQLIAGTLPQWETQPVELPPDVDEYAPDLGREHG